MTHRKPMKAPNVVSMNTPLRILSYNINSGSTDRLDVIHSVLAHCNADIIALTEADNRRAVETLAERLNMHHIWAQGSGDRHVATLSHLPIIDWHIHNQPPLTQAALETTLQLYPPPSAREGSGGEEEAAVITVYNVHLLPYLLLPFEIRRWQAIGKLHDVIRDRQPGPHLIVGDLNAVAPGDRVLQNRNPARMRRVMMLQLRLIFRLAIPRLLRAGYVDCYHKLHPGDDGFTWMTGNRTTRYDYIMADPILAASLRACRVVDDIASVHLASDHYPLLADFSL